MCNYCKNLELIKNLEEERLVKIINLWHRRDYLACNLLRDCWLRLSRSSVRCFLKDNSPGELDIEKLLILFLLILLESEVRK